ncbi:hypothetical protein O0L34_g4737 [Tuta absoluta]|nr:hypothetical protein O0L34_g4737 [Tuta absoluta]
MASESYLRIDENMPQSKPIATAVWHDHGNLATSTPGSSSETLFEPSSKFEVFSSFGDQECGEPSKPQHLIFDFTPDPEIDTQEAQEKCVAFWDFVKSHPLLEKMCVKPEPIIVPATVAKQEQDPVIEPQVDHTPAADALYKNANRLSFASRPQNIHCVIEDDDYLEEDPVFRGKTMPEPVKWTGPISMCTCNSTCPTCRKSKKKTKLQFKQTSQEPVKKLNKMLNEWDDKHPKSMESPGPVMQHIPILQRLPPQDQEPKPRLE